MPPAPFSLAVLVLCAALAAGCGGGENRAGPAPAPLFRQWSYPKGGLDSARGVVVTLHGGSWRVTGRSAALTMTPVVRQLTAEGYAVLNGTYQPGRRGIDGVEALYALARQRAGGRGVCAYGWSAGGSWALELAIRHRELHCVAAEAPPVDLAALGRISERGRGLLTDTFGPDLRAHSPIRGPFPRSTRILLSAATNDRVVPISQARRFRERWPQTQLVVLDPGRARGVHSLVSRASLRVFSAARHRFLRRVLG